MTPPAALAVAELAVRIVERLVPHPEVAHVPSDARLARMAELLLERARSGAS